MTKPKKQIGLLRQVAILFLVGVLLIGILSSAVLYVRASRNITEDLSSLSLSISSDLSAYIRQYPSHEWLLEYWYEHADTLDLSYDVDYLNDSATAQKMRLLNEHQLEFEPEYATTDEVEALPPEDQKLYAEILYSWVLTRINQLKNFYNLDYLFCVVTDEPYDFRFFLFDAGAEGSERGISAGQIYPLGAVFQATGGQQEAMRNAIAGVPQLARNREGTYIDYYYSFGSFSGHEMLIGLTRNLETFTSTIRRAAFSQSMVSVLFLATVAVLFLMMIQFAVLKPLKKVQENIRLYKNSKDSKTVVENLSTIRSRNELGQLSEDVVQLAQEMDDYADRVEKITADRERIETELNLASRIQNAMLPKDFPERKDFELFASMTPAREVGGDFYDFFLPDDSHLCLVVADVSGKGVPAALYMMASKITLSHLIKSGKSPAEVLTEGNASICSRNPEEMFVTVWLGILDLKTGVLTAANAGHEYPMLMHPDGKFELVKDKHGFVVGGMDGTKYEEYTLQLEPGSRLFLYTDGLTEAVNPENEMFGTDRILKVLNRRKDETPEKTLKRMQNNVAEFVQGAEPFDDLTMMCLTWHGPEEKK